MTYHFKLNSLGRNNNYFLVIARKMRKFIFILFVVSMWNNITASAEEVRGYKSQKDIDTLKSFLSKIEPASYRQINKVLTQKHVLPRYEIFSIQTGKMDAVAHKFCHKPNHESLSKLRESFHLTADSWAGIEHIQFGPIDEKLRLNRIYFWPDKHNTGSKHLGRLLKSKDKSLLEQERFTLISVALQGFPALERLLFSQSKALFSGNEDAIFRCLLIPAITGNLRKIAEAVLLEWKEENEGFLKVTTSNGAPFYSGENEIFQDFLTSLYGNLRTIHDLKLRRPLGETPEKSRPKRSEAWRSERSINNIILNLEAAKKLFQGEGGYGMDDFIKMLHPETNITNDFNTYLEHTLKTARNISLPLYKAVRNPEQHDQVERLQAQVQALMGFVRGRISNAVGMGTGFNVLDGD